MFLSRGFPGGSLVRDLPANAGDTSLIPGGGNGNPLQYPRLGNPMDRGAQQATVHGVAKSQTRLSNFHFWPFTSYTGGGNVNLLQSSCLENPPDRGVLQATVPGVPRVGHDLETKPPPPLAIWPWPIYSNHMHLSFFTWKMGPQYLLCFVAIRIKEKTNINQLAPNPKWDWTNVE